MPTAEDDFFDLINEPTVKQPAKLPAPDDDFFDLIKNDPTTTQAKSNLNVTRDLDPDKEAEYYDLAKRSTLPVSTVRLVPEEVKRNLEYPIKIISSSERFKRYFAARHSNASISRDDVDNLSNVENVIDTSKSTIDRLLTESPTVGGVARTAAAATALGISEIPKSLGNLFDFVAPLIVDKRKLDYAEKNLQPITLSTDMQEWLRGKYGDTKAEELVGSSFESLGTMAAFFVTGGESAILPGISAVSGIGKTTEAMAGGADRSTAITAGIYQAATEYLTEKIPLDILRTPATSFIKKLAQGIVFDVPGELASTANEMWLIDQGILGGEHKTKDEYKQALIDTALVSMITTTAATAPTHAVQKALGQIDTANSRAADTKAKELDQNKAFHDSMTAEREAIGKTLTAERSRDHMKEFINTVDGDKDVYISSEGIDKLYQTHTEEEAAKFLTDIGIEPTAAQATILSGEDTTVKINDIRTMPEQDYSKISDDIKPAPGAYTQREIQEDKANEDVENLVKLVAEDVAKTKVIDSEIARIQEEGKAAGLSKDTIDTTPVLIRGIANKLEREGLDTAEFLNKISFKKEKFVDTVKGLFQADTTKKRGAVTLDNERHTIYLFEDADMSTVLHEVGHVALKEYMNIEQIGKASDSLKKDMTTLREWVGLEEGAAFEVPHMEQVARGFEAYLMEGKAPTKGLAAAFERFKHFLINTYKSAKALNVKLNPQVRQVFDRMVSTNLEVEAMAATGGFTVKTVAEMQALGMTKPDQFYATQRIDQTTKKAERRLSQARNKNYKDNITTWREESRSELREENPTYDIISSIILENPISREEFIESYGKDAISLLPDRRILRKEGEQEVRGSREEDLRAIRRLISEGEAKRSTAKRDVAGDIIGSQVTGGTLPSFMTGFLTFDKKKKQKGGMTSSEAITAIDNELQGKVVTKRQKQTSDMLLEGYRDEIEAAAFRIEEDPDVEFPFGEFAKPTVKRTGQPLDKVAVIYGYDDSIEMINEFFDTPNFNKAVTQRVEQKVAQHDAQFQVEDYIVDLPEYRDYLNIMARYITGQTVDESIISKGIQQNIGRWEKEARSEITEEQPDLTGKELEKAINARAQEKIDQYQQKKAKPAAISIDTLKALALDTMSAKTVKEAQRVDKYLSAMKKAANDERRAILRKDWGAASEANETARFNYELAGLSVKVRDEVDTIQKRVKRIAKKRKVETIDFKHKDAIFHLANRYKLAAVVPRDLAVEPNYDALFKGDETDAEFKDYYSNDGFRDYDFIKTKISDFRDLRVEQLRNLDKAIRYLEGKGRISDKGTLSTGESLIEIGQGSMAEMDAQKARTNLDNYNPLASIAKAQRGFFSRLWGLPFITQALGGYKSLSGKISFVEKHIMERLRDMLDVQSRRFRETRLEVQPYRDHIVEAQKKMLKKYGRKLFVSDNGVPVPALLQNNGKQLNYWTPEQIFSMAFNRGNDSNTNALINGYYGLTLPQVDTLLAKYLTVDDVRAVQNIIDTIEALAPEADAIHLKVKNYHMDKIKARPWTFKGHEFKGGYFPLDIDRELASVDHGVFNTLTEETDFFKSNASKFTTPFADASHTMSRTEGHGLPVNLSLIVIDKHIDKAIRYITMAEGIRDVVKILNYTESVTDADGKLIKKVGFKQSATRIIGKEIHAQIAPAIKHFANPQLEGVDIAGNKARVALRSMAAAAHLTGRVLTGIKQLPSIIGGVNAMSAGEGGGFAAYAKGVGYTISGPSVAFQTMLDKSPRMRERMASYDRDVLKSRFDKMTPQQREITFGDRSVSWKDVQDAAFLNISFPDKLASVPIWWGSYLDKLNDSASNEKEAVRYADNLVETTQPTAQPLNMSDWFRSGGFWGIFNQHQTYTVGTYLQRQRAFTRAFLQGDITAQQFAKFNFLEGFMANALIQIVISMVKGGHLGDPEEQKKILTDTLLNWGLLGVPMALSFYHAITEGWSSPLEIVGAREVENWTRTGHFLYKHRKHMSRKEREKAMWGLFDVVSDISKVPMSRVAKQVIEGDTLMEKTFGKKKR